MQTWKFDLATATDVDIFDTLVGYVRFYELTSGGGSDARIRLKSLGGGINVELLAGQGYKLDKPVRGLVVENMSGVAISGKLAISPDTGRFEDDRITGQVSLDAATLLALEYVQNRPEQPTSYSNAITLLGATTAENVVLPAANVNGLIVYDAQATAYQGGSTPTYGGLLAKASAPANVGDGMMVAPFKPVFYDNVNTIVYAQVALQKPIYVPAGLGLYWYNSAAIAANQPRSVIWKVL